MRIILLAMMFSASTAMAAQNLENRGKFKPRKALPAACKLAEEGDVAGQWKSVRVEKNGQAVTGADRFEELVAVVQQLDRQGECRPTPQHCELQSEGSAAGRWQKHRIFMDGAPVMGANDMGTLLERLAELQSLGFCS